MWMETRLKQQLRSGGAFLFQTLSTVAPLTLCYSPRR